MSRDPNTNSKTKSWAIAGLLISWGTFWLFLLSPFGCIAWTGILIYLIVKKAHLKWYIVFSAWLFVPAFNFLTGSVRYFTGTASMKAVGGPETYHGIDPDTRVPSTSSGCIFSGIEPFIFPTNNAAIRLWTSVFGYQRGAYTGVYPTKDEVKILIKTADTLNVEPRNDHFLFITNDSSVRVETLELYRFRRHGQRLDKVIGKALDKQCFVFQPFDSQDNYYKEVYLVDIVNRQILTRYFIEY